MDVDGRACTLSHVNGLHVGGGCCGRRFGRLAVFGRWEFGECGTLCWGGRRQVAGVVWSCGMFWWLCCVLRVRCCFACAVRFARFWVFVCGGSLARWSGSDYVRVNPGELWPRRGRSSQRARRGGGWAHTSEFNLFHIHNAKSSTMLISTGTIPDPAPGSNNCPR